MSLFSLVRDLPNASSIKKVTIVIEKDAGRASGTSQDKVRVCDSTQLAGHTARAVAPRSIGKARMPDEGFTRASAIKDGRHSKRQGEAASNESRAFQWKDSTLIVRFLEGDTSSEARDNNNRGQVVGMSATAGIQSAVLWT